MRTEKYVFPPQHISTQSLGDFRNAFLRLVWTSLRRSEGHQQRIPSGVGIFREQVFFCLSSVPLGKY